jgi:small subunit ribosomal protein S4
MTGRTGPRLKKLRAIGRDLPGLTRKTVKRRAARPGPGANARRRRPSDFGMRLTEKQALRLHYGVSERQLRGLMREALASPGNSANRLLEYLERRLDNVVYRAGFAPTIPAARQLVGHGHINVNGRRTTFPAYRTKQGDVISVKEKSRQLPVVMEGLQSGILRPSWLGVDPSSATANVTGVPDPQTVPVQVDARLVVEFYGARL